MKAIVKSLNCLCFWYISYTYKSETEKYSVVNTIILSRWRNVNQSRPVGSGDEKDWVTCPVCARVIFTVCVHISFYVSAFVWWRDKRDREEEVDEGDYVRTPRNQGKDRGRICCVVLSMSGAFLLLAWVFLFFFVFVWWRLLSGKWYQERPWWGGGIRLEGGWTRLVR